MSVLITEDLVLGLLAQRHKDDVFVAHCKNGPTNTFGSKVLILDGWAMPATWSPLTSIGYEVKVSRSDWLRDDKYQKYMGLCHLFYVVAPKGVVDAGELPDGAGLIEVTSGGRSLLTRRKAVRRDVQMPVELMAYALMWRTSARRDKAYRAAEWKGWAERRKEFNHIGMEVKSRIKADAEKIERENYRLQRLHATYDNVRLTLIELGIDPDHVQSWNLDRQIENAMVRQRVSRLTAQLSGIVDELNRIAQPEQKAESA